MEEDSRQLLTVRSAVRRFVRSRSADGETEDVVQEAMARLLENRARLAPSAWEAYAVVSARNLLRDGERAAQVRRRHVHRLHEPDLRTGPEEQVLTEEEHSAVRRALTTLPAEDVSLLEERYGHDGPQRSVPGSLATRLARARARLRLAYLLEHTGVALPTERCRPVLESLSSGDRRRQDRLGAARHVAVCRVCASYAPVLVQRRRSLAALHPLAWAGATLATAWAAARRHPASSTAAAGVVLAGAITLVAVSAPDGGVEGPSGSVAAGSAQPSLTVGGRPLPPPDGGTPPLGPATARAVPVQAVPADEGFWVGAGPGRRAWVQLVGDGESGITVRVGDRVSFDGVAVPVQDGFPAAAGLSRAEGSDELARLGVVVEVPRTSLVVR